MRAHEATRRHLPALVVLVLLAGLLALSVLLADVSSGVALRLAVLGLAAPKVALVASEYVEVRGSARWLTAVWTVWWIGTFAGLAILSV
ncbi:hypothetical protein [Nocardioides jejuensis]|uniref:Uncharacterized protein n=1 Tax=Nocardioides jejuensis TaxID=2502782 RepID=A0A4R1CKR6_9ACTN|nr:hypothetical protein [Nocardioides jejuensis]TCJ30806.1 hypothetical protein EPD65_01855 [Nocardioides jejuensis]